MKKLALALMGFVLLACGHKSPPTPPPTVDTTPPPPPPPSEAAPFTVTYTYKAKVDGQPLLFMLASDGAVDAAVVRPPTRYTGKTDDGTLGDIARMIANPAVRALPASSDAGPVPIVEVELQDAHGALWRRHIAGPPPDAAAALFNRLENLQSAARRESRPVSVLRVDDTRTASGGGPTELLSIDANSLVLLTVDGKPKALGRVGQSDLDDLRLACGLLDRLRPTPASGPGKRHAIHVERADGTKLDIAFDGGIPLAAELLFAKLDELEAGAKPVALFDKITYTAPALDRGPGKGKAKPGVAVLTVLPTGALTLKVGDATIGSGQAAIEELWGLHSVLVGFEALPVGKPVGKGGEVTLRVEGPTGTREVRTSLVDPPPESKKVLQYMNRFVFQLTPLSLPDEPTPPKPE